VYRRAPPHRREPGIGEVFDAELHVHPYRLVWGRQMSTSLSSLTSLLPAASVIITGVIVGVLLARVDNRAEERLDP
jgi:hypothetical protein